MIKKALFALTVMAAAVGAQANVVTFTSSYGQATTNWNQTLMLNQFDPLQGTLTGVSFAYNGTVISNIKVESLDSAPATLTATANANLTFGGPISQALSISASAIQALSAFDGAIDFGGTSGFTFAPISGSNSGTFLPAGSLASYIGLGNFGVLVGATGFSTASGPGNLISQVGTTAKAEIAVTYTFNPLVNQVPEPGSLYLLGLALVGAGVATRRRKLI